MCLFGFNAVVLISGYATEDTNNSVFVLSWIVLYAISIIPTLLSNAEADRRSFTILIFCFFLFVGSSVWSPNTAKTFTYSSMLFLNVFFAYHLAKYINIFDFFKTMFYVLLLMVILGIFAFVVGYDNAFYSDHHQRLTMLNTEPLRGFFAHKIMAALYSIVGLVLSCVILNGWRRNVSIALFLFFILLTGSSTGITLIIFLIAFYAFFKACLFFDLSYRGFWLSLFGLLFCTAVVAFFIIVPILDFLGRDLTLTGRTYLWEWGIRAFLERWVVGWGFLGYFETSHYWFLQRNYDSFENYEVPHFHNSFIQTAVNFGSIGLLLLCYMLGFTLKVLYLHYKKTNHAYMLACILLVFLFIFSSTTMHLFFNYNHAATFAIFFLYFSLSRLKREQRL